MMFKKSGKEKKEEKEITPGNVKNDLIPACQILVQEYLVPGIARLLEREFSKIESYKQEITDLNKAIVFLRKRTKSLDGRLRVVETEASTALGERLFGNIFEKK